MYKEVLFLTKSGLTKSYKGLIFISEKAWAPCFMCLVLKKSDINDLVLYEIRGDNSSNSRGPQWPFSHFLSGLGVAKHHLSPLISYVIKFIFL